MLFPMRHLMKKFRVSVTDLNETLRMAINGYISLGKP